MRIKQEVKKIIHQNIEEYALKVNIKQCVCGGRFPK